MDTLTFIQNMAVILMAVGFVSVVFTRFGLPRAIGYILAGVLLGQYTLGGSLITRNATETINVLGQMGVLFLMFTLGLEFSLRKLKEVGGVALPTGILDLAVMVWAGHFVGTHFLGMGDVPSLFLGAALSDSATTVLAKTIDELGWKRRPFTGYVMGITMTEDILCVGLIALLTGVARNHGAMDWTLIGSSLGGLSLFLICVVVFGLLLVPRTANWVGRLKDDESLLLCILGFCFLVAFIAIKLDYGVALGAFLVGMMCAESNVVARIYRQSVALRSMFSAIFFVTIGLVVDPAQLWLYKGQILALSALVILGKTLNCTIGSLLLGQRFKDSLQTGMSMAQVGEFALIIAFLGVHLEVFSAQSMFYPVVVGVSLLTTMLNSILIRLSDPLADFVEARMPSRWKAGIQTYGNWVARFRTQRDSGKNRSEIRFDFILLAILLAIEIAIFVTAGMLKDAAFLKMLPKDFHGHEQVLLWMAALFLTTPCSIFYFHRSNTLGERIGDFLIPEKARDTSWAQAFKRLVTVVVVCISLAVLFIVATMFSNTLLPENQFEKWLVLIFIAVLGIVGWTRFRHMGGEALETLREVVSREGDADSGESAADLLDIHTERLTVPAGASVCGKSLRELNLRATTGASVIGIDRRGHSTVNPTADEKLLPGDRVLLLGDDEQLAAARRLIATVG
ncbi:MAG: cation:proton antiporter [Kiritimatiellae bacterium]|nr:cation:proton antiporter [Kiritimatiellia bacterium]